jgi:hypothetical protein
MELSVIGVVCSILCKLSETREPWRVCLAHRHAPTKAFAALVRIAHEARLRGRPLLADAAVKKNGSGA